MSTTILNFDKCEIVAANKQEAVEQMEKTMFNYYGDATQAYKLWLEKQRGTVSDRDLKEFMLDYLAKKSKNSPGLGFLITLDPAVKDTRNRPYKIENVKNEEGKRKFHTVYVAVDDETGVTIGKWDTNKADALNGVKKLYKDGLYKGKGCLNKIKEVVEGQATVATFEYAPSKNTKVGRYLAFGVKA